MKKGMTFVEILVGGCVLLIFLSFLMIPFVHLSSSRSGTHTGYITAIEQEGYFFPNYRVYVKTDNSSSQEDKYCMDRSKTDLANKIKEWSQKRKLVSVSYEGVRGFGLGLCEDIQITNVVEQDK